MKVSEDLFLLIKSLNKSEKRHFSLFSGLQEGDKFYMTVFNLIDRQKIYNEKKIIAHFKSASHVKQFPVIKSYLYYAILKSLNYYSRGEATGKEIRELLSYAELLFKRGLYAQCKKILFKAKQIALSLNKHALLLDILNWETKLMLIENKEHLLEEHTKEITSTLNDIANINSYRTHAFRLHTLFNQVGKPRNKEDVKQYKTIYESSFFKNEEEATTVQSKWLLYNLKTNYARAMDDKFSGYTYSKKAVAHIEKYPALIFEDPDMYIASMQNFIVVLLDLRKSDECLEAIRRLREYSKEKKLAKNRSALIRIFTLSYIAELDLLFKRGEFDEGLVNIKEVETGIEKFRGGLSKYNEIILCCCISRLYFGAGKFKKALLWLNRATQIPSESRQDVISFMKIFNLIIHFELGNTDVLPYIIKSTYRYFYKAERLFQFEKVIIDFLRKLKSTDTRKQLKILLTELKEEFILLSNNPLEKNAFEYFEYISWLESKITEQAFEKIVKEKAKSD